VRDVPELRYATNGDARIAYMVTGEDGPPVLAVPPLAQNIELAWERPEIAHMLGRYGSFSRYVHFDKRGTGASDPIGRPGGGLADLEDRVDDMVAVLDDVGIERAHLYGVSDGGPMAVLFAVTHPERVSSLVVNGSAATFMPDGERVDHARRARWEQFVQRWGTPETMSIDIFAPSLAGDEDYLAWQPRYERGSASRQALRELLAMNAAIDVRDLLSSVRVPTLQIHRSGDRAVPIEDASDLAGGIPGARFVELPGDDHWEFAGDADAHIDVVEAWLGGVETSGSFGVRPRRRSRVDRPSSAAPPLVRVDVLGGFRVVRDGEEVPVSDWGSRRARQLCKALVLAQGAPLRREVLMELLWPDDTSDRLGARLSVLLSTVRRVLGSGVVADREVVRLDLDVVATDLAEIEAVAADDRAVLDGYAELLPEDAYEDWTVPARDRVRHAALSAGSRLLGRSEEAGEVLAIADRLLAIDPHHDVAHRRRVAALAGRGDRGAAIEAHDRYVAAMAEIGVEAAGFAQVTSGNGGSAASV